MRGNILTWSVISALAGFLFGVDTVVISGAEQTIQRLWGLSDWVHGIAMGSAIYGTVVGAILGGLPTDRFGRRPTLFWIGVLYLVSAVWSGLATDVWSFIAARFIGGLGVGASTIAAPLYISEIAPSGSRGRLAGLFQFNIVFGILVAFLSNSFIAGTGPDDWRWMLGAEAVPAALYTLACLTIPESPRWLGRAAARGSGRTAAVAANAAAAPPAVRLRRPLTLAFLVAVFNQLSGINAVLYFAPRIFEMAGLGERAAMLQSIGIGVTNLVFTFVGLGLIDRIGRRTLLAIGATGCLVSLGVCAWAFASGHERIVPACIFALIASHAIGQGTVIWVLISEIFPDRFRALGQSLGSATHWVCAAAITTVFPVMASWLAPQVIFGFFAVMMVVQLVWIATSVPETKSLSLEEVSARVAG